MKKKILGLVTAVMIFTGGSIYAFGEVQENCPDKGTAKCKLIKNCPDKRTPQCKLVTEKKTAVPPCCLKPKETAALKKSPAKI